MVQGEDDVGEPLGQCIRSHAWFDRHQVTVVLGVPRLTVGTYDWEIAHSGSLKPASKKGNVLAVWGIKFCESYLFKKGIVWQVI